ncbi:MAG: clpC, partial [Massilibacillus sp.]|nr:clpC [Massilibacillus sp.]
MNSRFTTRAIKVLELAQYEAQELGHNYVGTEHLLLGLIREGEGVAAKALLSLEIDLETVRSQVEELIGHGKGASEGFSYTPRAKRVMELALAESQLLGHNYIGTEHILLGLIREDEGVAARVLSALGADVESVREIVMDMLGGSAANGGNAGEGKSVAKK